jgi:S-DNA-T family DNA segregation ATPase FtsK/SpoIIIE
VAVAVFLGFVLYLGWDGGSLGRWLGGAFRWLFGMLAYVLPVLLCYGAYVVVARDDRRPRRGVSWGIGMMAAAFLLAAAADAFGLFGGARPAALFRDGYMQTHGGLAGEAEWAVLQPLVGRLGVLVLVIALFLAGVLLATGSTLRGWATSSREGVAAAGRAARTQAEALGARRRDGAVTRASRADEDVEAGEETTIDAFDELRTTVTPAAQYGPAVSTHTPHLIDGAQAAPEIFGAGTPAAAGPDPSPSPPVCEAPSDDHADTGRQLSLASAAAGETADDEVARAFREAEKRQWSLPDASLLQRLGETVGESPEAIGKVSQRLVETLGHFNVPARVIGTVSGPRVTRYELVLEPGIKVSKVASLKDDLAYSLAATDVRVQAPIPGKQAVGVEVPNIQANYVSLGDIHGLFPPHASPMAFWLGKDVTGKAVLSDLV